MEQELGAIWDGRTTRFAVQSHFAESIDLCFFESPDSGVETRRVPLRRGAGDLWRAELDDAPPGALYGLRASGPWQPRAGHLFNPAKLLVDPMARAVTSEVCEASATYGFELHGPHDAAASTFNGSDSAPFMPKCVVVDPSFDWQGVEAPRVPWRDTVIYEAHVRGLSRLHPDVPEEHRGTYLGLCSPPILEHLMKLGVTAVELMPVAQIASEPHLAQKNLRNYWGYSPLAFCAPNARYACAWDGRQVSEFKTMVRELHRCGIEVLLDVVYNHTAEGGHGGPTLSLRGLDHQTYYRLHPRNGIRHLDVTGCGNTLDIGAPAVRRLILESLRYWTDEMRVDGFRFDLGPVFGRDLGHYRRDSVLFQEISEDPVLSRVKLIAEPWDVGHGGYQLGNFPPGWAEWNDRFRDAARRFWHGDPATWGLGGSGEFSWRMAGSAELFDEEGRGPLSGIHFVACHDGFTLEDAVSYEQKHNEDNLEDNRDGHDHNLSCNWGAEGPSDDPQILARREQAKRNLFASVALSQGVPMLLHGDELGRTQQGNNNAYCQDNPISWMHWDVAENDRSFLEFVRLALALRRDCRSLRRERYVDDARFAPDGEAIAEATWDDLRAFGIVQGDELLILINGALEDIEFQPPNPWPWDRDARRSKALEVALETAARPRTGRALDPPWRVDALSILVLRPAQDPDRSA